MKIEFHHSDLRTLKRPEMPTIVCKVEYLTTEPCLVDGRQLSQSKFAVDDSSDRYKGLTALDFCLENQLAAGVNLKSAFVQPSNFAAVDSALPNVIKLSESISNNIKSA